MGERPDSRLEIDVSRLGWVGPLAIVCSIAAVLVVRTAAAWLLRPDPKFTPLGWAFPILDTAITTTGAVLVFGAMASSAATPIKTFRRTATIVLILSLVPAGATAFSRAWGGSWVNAAALATMHVAAWAVCVSMLTILTLRRREDSIGAERGR
jgi:hypothetical protein